ncbi:MAG: hypothetical protein Tsb0014_47590 [Pleurocapsa sp.]
MSLASDRAVWSTSLNTDLKPVEPNQQLLDTSPRGASFIVSQSYDSNYYNKLIEADRFYKQGNLQVAEKIQREVKPDFPEATPPPAAQVDLMKLPPQAQQDWSTANEAIEEDPEDEEEINTRIFEPLESLVDNYPSFIPGQILLADTYDLYGWEDDALETIELAAETYPERNDLLDKKIELLLAYGKPLEASISAREFAYAYPDHPQAAAYKQAADEYFQEYQSDLKSKITASSVFGGIGQAATGNEDQALAVGQMLLQGESSAGQAFSESYKSQAKMVSNAEQLKYLDGIGQKLAKLMGRDEFTYEFNIIEDPTPNAFALPGGKIFFHTGMLQLMDSEAELAGVLAHEIAHSVLSHGYSKIGESALTSTASSLLGSLAGKEVGTIAQVGEVLLNQKFSRDKEKQADILGLRVLDASGYAADGLYNVMEKLKQLQGESNLAESLLSSHPASEDRMRYLEELIQTKGYNRYGYEGVEAYRKVFPR